MTPLADAIRWDGWIHLIQDGHDLPRGPLGVLTYLPLALLFRYVPTRLRSAYLIASSLLVSFLTLGPAFTGTLLMLALLSLGLVRAFAERGRVAAGVVVATMVYIGLLLVPRPPWLPAIDTPPLREPIWFYLHWAGLAYLFLRTVHVLVDVGQARIPSPAGAGFLAYLLFAPTLRMGPIYRYDEFDNQLRGDLRPMRSLPEAGRRLLIGLVRLGIMAVLLKQARLDRLFGEPEQLYRLSADRFVVSLYIAPMTIYLWISGYTDLAVGLGRAMGFVVPENFRYPWVATSLADFWRRWHLTLGSWLRDYIYIPLGGNRCHVSLNYVITFLICGLWHGTRPAMVLWGLSQGIGLALWRAWNSFWKRQREIKSGWYQAARILKLTDSPLAAVLAWLLTIHYQILTITIIMDEAHAGRFILARLLEMLGLRG